MQFRKSLELKTVGRSGKNTGDTPDVLALCLPAFPRYLLGTQSVGR